MERERFSIVYVSETTDYIFWEERLQFITTLKKTATTISPFLQTDIWQFNFISRYQNWNNARQTLTWNYKPIKIKEMVTILEFNYVHFFKNKYSFKKNLKSQ